jgi:hypothetical protein
MKSATLVALACVTGALAPATAEAAHLAFGPSGGDATPLAALFTLFPLAVLVAHRVRSR